MLSDRDFLSRVEALPQASHIDRSTALKWLRGTLRVDAPRVEWHLRRAGGFGGSDIGALIASYEGRHNVFSSAREIVRSKLLLGIPDGETDDTRRGTELESHIRSVFERRLVRNGHRWARRDDLKNMLQDGPHPRYRWHLSSPDEIYEIDGLLCVVDFKAPTQDVLDSYRKYGGFDNYIYQTHHYAEGAIAKGARIDRLILAMYDYKRNDVEIFDVEMQQAVFERIIEVGEFYWNNHVLQGRVPEHRVRLKADFDPPPEIIEASNRYVVNKIVSDKASADAADDREIVERWVARQGVLGDRRLTLAEFMDVKGSEVVDTEAAATRLLELGMSPADLEALRAPPKFDSKKIEAAYVNLLEISRDIVAASMSGGGIDEIVARLARALETAPIRERGGFDEEKIRAALVSCSERPERFVTEKLSSALPRGKRQDFLERKEAVAARLSQLTGSLAAPAIRLPGKPEPEADTDVMRFGF